jgi:hypothetical protein
MCVCRALSVASVAGFLYQTLALPLRAAICSPPTSLLPTQCLIYYCCRLPVPDAGAAAARELLVAKSARCCCYVLVQGYRSARCRMRHR